MLMKEEKKELWTYTKSHLKSTWTKTMNWFQWTNEIYKRFKRMIVLFYFFYSAVAAAAAVAILMPLCYGSNRWWWIKHTTVYTHSNHIAHSLRSIASIFEWPFAFSQFDSVDSQQNSLKYSICEVKRTVHMYVCVLYRQTGYDLNGAKTYG